MTAPKLVATPKPVQIVPITPPPQAQRVGRQARFAKPGERKTRYSLPDGLDSASPVGFRTRVSLTTDEAAEALQLLSLERPTAFTSGPPVLERELFEECALGVLSARQSTNFRGYRQVTVGARDSVEIAHLMRGADAREADPLDDAAYTHIVLARPYRTPFTLLLTFIGHRPVVSLATVAVRALRKRFQHVDDIPTVGYLPHLHIGILADCMERAAVIASAGTRRALVFMSPFCDEARAANVRITRRIEELAGMTGSERRAGWRVALISQVGTATDRERLDLKPETYRKLGANLMAFRSERIQPGVNQEDKAPEPYQGRQDMRVPDELTTMAGRAAYNAFSHWSGVDRERAKELLLLDRIDVLTPNGKERLRALRRHLADISERIIKNVPLWADLPTGKAFSRNARRGKKAFALAGQRIYLTGLSRKQVEAAGLGWKRAIRAVGAAASRSSLLAELMGVVDVPEGCDLLAGICLMAGPVNQNDIGKSFYGSKDLLAETFPDLDPTSLLVWTLKAKTVADPIGNEEQLLSAQRKGALVDLRPGPHEVIQIRREAGLHPMRSRGGNVNQERAFEDVGNFVRSTDGIEIPGNRGERWPSEWRDEPVW